MRIVSRYLAVFLVVLLASASLLGCTQKNTQMPEDTPINLSIGTIFPEDSAEGIAANFFAEKVAKDSNGRINVDVFHASALGGAVAQMENVMAGTQDMFLEGHEYYGHYVKGWNILGFFFAFRDREHLHKFLKSEKNKEFEQELIDNWGMRVISTEWNFDRGPYKVVVSNKPIRTINDFQGTKIRAPDIPLYIRSLEALGGAVATIDWGETYLAISQGIVDAVESPIGSVVTMKFHEVAPNVTFTKHLLQPASIVINEDKFQSLSDDLKEVLINAANAAGNVYTEEVIKLEKTAIEQLKENGINLIEHDELDIDNWRSRISEVALELEKEGYWPAGVWDEIQRID